MNLIYKGEQPTLIPPPNLEKVLELMIMQLEILKLAAVTHVMIPEGTRIRRENL